MGTLLAVPVVGLFFRAVGITAATSLLGRLEPAGPPGGAAAGGAGALGRDRRAPLTSGCPPGPRAPRSRGRRVTLRYFLAAAAAFSSRASTFLLRRSSSASDLISVRSCCSSAQPYQVT